MAVAPPAQVKAWWKSKTIWVSFLALISAILQARYGWIAPPEYQAYGLTVIMFVLRLITKQPVSLT